jgi:hypothetical protein
MTPVLLHSKLRRMIALVLVPASLFLSGCFKPKTGIVAGKVMYNGRPVTGGKISFVGSPDVSSVPVEGRINPDGSFTVSNVPMGLCKVSFDTSSLKDIDFTKIPVGGGRGGPGGPGGGGPGAGKGGPPRGMGGPGNNTPRYMEIPKKYYDPETSGETVEVAQGETTSKTFELK